MAKNLLYIFCLLMIFISCKKQNDKSGPSPEPISLIGYWHIDSVETKIEVDTPEYYYIKQVHTTLFDDYHLEILDDDLANWHYGPDDFDSVEYAHIGEILNIYFFMEAQNFGILELSDAFLGIIKIKNTAVGRESTKYYMHRE